MRKRRAVKRDVLPDPIYNSKVVTKLVNTLMIGGKKGTAQKILYPPKTKAFMQFISFGELGLALSVILL